MRLRQRLLDPRVLVWLSGGVFLIGYMVWEILERGSVDTVTRNTNRASEGCFFLHMPSNMNVSSRSEDAEGLNPCLLGADVPFTGLEDSDRCDFFGFHMGVVSMSLHPKCSASRLHRHETT